MSTATAVTAKMPVSNEKQRQLLNHYRIATLYPDKWPLPDNESSDEDEEQTATTAPARQVSKLSIDSRSSFSKYRNIDRHASVRSQTTDSESLVQTDEPDALGMAPSVATQLKRRGVPIDSSTKIRMLQYIRVLQHYAAASSIGTPLLTCLFLVIKATSLCCPPPLSTQPHS